MSGMAEQSLHRRVRELEATVTAMQNAFMAQEKAAMGMADVASDVRAMRKEQDSHRYDLRLLKASVGELISSDRAYALELEQARRRLESSVSAAAESSARGFDRQSVMAEMMQEFEGRVEKMVEEKVLACLSRREEELMSRRKRRTRVARDSSRSSYEDGFLCHRARRH